MEKQKTYLIIFLELLSFVTASGVIIFTPLILLDKYGILFVISISLLLLVIKTFITSIFTICVLNRGNGFHYNAFFNIKDNLFFLIFLLIFDIILSFFLSYTIIFVSMFLSYLPIFCISLIYKRLVNSNLRKQKQ